jgi:prophage DNA circulation protein
MSWDAQLDTASFGGVEFEVLSINDDVSRRRIAQHKYPYRDGADLDDMGREPRHTSMSVIFSGDEYETQLNAFLGIVDEGETATFRHPILGQWEAKASVTSLQFSPDDRDSATLQVEFTEDGTDTKLPSMLSIPSIEAEIESWLDQISLENIWGYSEITSAITAVRDAVAKAQTMVNKLTSAINQARKKIETALDKLKELTDVENYKCVRALKRCAYSLQKLGVRYQELHPPSTKKSNPVPAPLVIMAIDLYGAKARERAGELADMNDIRNPLFAQPGDIKVYTR